MLEFWFDPQTSILKKISLFVIIALVTGGLYLFDPLRFDVILMFLGTGIIFLICRYCKIHFVKSPLSFANRIFTWVPIACIIALVFAYAQQEILILGAQGIGFTALAVCIFSPLSLLNKNHTKSDESVHD